MLSSPPTKRAFPRGHYKPPPLQDLTNEGRVQKIKDAFLSSEEKSPILSSTPKNELSGKDIPKEGTVSKAQEMFDTPLEQGVKSKILKSPVRQAVPFSEKIRPLSCNTPRGSHSSGELVWELAEKPKSKTSPPPSIAKESKSSHGHKLFSRKAPSTGCSSKGAISTLCLQAASLELEDSQASTSGGEGTSSPPPESRPQQDYHEVQGERKKNKGKFLEGSWLPKKFFRVSKLVFFLGHCLQCVFCPICCLDHSCSEIEHCYTV